MNQVLSNPYKFFLSFVLLFFSLTLSADDHIAVLLKSTSHPFWKTIYDAIEETAKEENIKVSIRATNNKNDTEAQLNICETILLEKPKALIVGAINPFNLGTCLKKFNAQKIPVIDIDGNLTKEVKDKVGIKVEFSVASDNYQIGKSAAEYLSQAIGKLLIIEGLPGSYPSIQRVKGFKDNLPQGLQVVASLPANWDRLKASTIARDIFTRHPDLKYVYAVSDGMAVGAAEAIVELKKAGVTVVGVDGESSAIKAIKQGKMLATVAQLPYLMGQKAIIETNRFLNNPEQTPEYNQFVPIVTIDQEFLDLGNNPLIQYLR